jgi:hypothetical protein
MPTPAGKGNTNFREVSVDEQISKSGLDGLTVVLRGIRTQLATEKAKWKRGAKYTGYANMYLETKSTRDSGPVAELILNFTGFIDNDTPDNGLIDIEDSITSQSVTLNTDADENISFRYFAQVATVRWISRTKDAPRSPKFPGIVPSSIPTNLLFQPDPPKYTGSIAGRYEPIGRLAQFSRMRLAPGVWAVVESWENLIEPKST